MRLFNAPFRFKFRPCQIKDENGEEEVAVVGEIVDEEEDDQIMIAYRWGLHMNPNLSMKT